MQEKTDKVAEEVSQIGLQINEERTKLMFIKYGKNKQSIQLNG